MSTSAREQRPATGRRATPSRSPRRRAKRRMLIIVNPYATTVSDRLRNLVVYALQGRFEVDAVDTEARGHATELCREAAHEGYDVVVAFGGDGTVNEAANGLLGSATPLCCLPGGSANVFGKMLGIPGEIVDATEHLLAMADDWRPRKVDLGRRQRPLLHVRLRPRPRRERRRARRRQPAPEGALRALLLHLGGGQHVPAPLPAAPAADGRRTPAGRRSTGVTAIVQNGSPFTYFQDRPIEIAEGAALDSGALAGVRAAPRDAAGDAVRSPGARSRAARASPATARSPASPTLSELTVRSADGRPLPLQVDGDYLGEVTEARYSILPRRAERRRLSADAVRR